MLLLCKAVQLSLSPLKGEGAMSCLSHCDRASSYMSSSVAIPLTQSGNLLNKVLLKKKKKVKIQTLFCSLDPVWHLAHSCIYMVHSEFNHAHVYRYKTDACIGGGQVSCQWGCVGAQCGWQEVAVVHCSCIA